MNFLHGSQFTESCEPPEVVEAPYKVFRNSNARPRNLLQIINWDTSLWIMCGIVACWQDQTLPLLALQNIQLRSERVCLREL